MESMVRTQSPSRPCYCLNIPKPVLKKKKKKRLGTLRIKSNLKQISPWIGTEALRLHFKYSRLHFKRGVSLRMAHVSPRNVWPPPVHANAVLTRYKMCPVLYWPGQSAMFQLKEYMVVIVSLLFVLLVFFFNFYTLNFKQNETDIQPCTRKYNPDLVRQ